LLQCRKREGNGRRGLGKGRELEERAGKRERTGGKGWEKGGNWRKGLGKGRELEERAGKREVGGRRREEGAIIGSCHPDR
jgi:hypothetical protein